MSKVHYETARRIACQRDTGLVRSSLYYSDVTCLSCRKAEDKARAKHNADMLAWARSTQAADMARVAAKPESEPADIAIPAPIR
jgi:hypothetical protein